MRTDYRPGLNSEFVARVQTRRAAKTAEVARLAEEMAKIRARREELALARMERAANEDADRVPVPSIIKMVADAHGIRPVDITGRARRKEVVRARFEAIVLVSEARPEWSFNRIGRVFSRDPTTIWNALKVMGAWPRKSAA